MARADYKTVFAEFLYWILSDETRLDRFCNAKHLSKTGMPTFFYRNPVFSPIGGKRKFLTGTIWLDTGVKLTEKELSLLEKIAIHIDPIESQSSGTCVAAALIKEEESESLQTLISARFTIRSQSAGRRISFPFFSRAEEVSDGKWMFRFSKETTLFWRIDTTLSPRTVEETILKIDHPFARNVVRGALGTFTKNAKRVSVEAILKRMGYDVPLSMREKFEIKNVLSGANIDQAGLRYDNSMLLYNHSKKPEYDFIPFDFFRLFAARKFDVIEKAVADISKKDSKAEKVAEDRIGRAAEKVKPPTPAPKQRGSFFEAKTIGEAEGFFEVCQKVWDEWVVPDACVETFEAFREHWTIERKERKKDWKRTWLNWIKRSTSGYSIEYFPMEIAIEEAVRIGLDEFAARSVFEKFRNYYIANGAVRKKWLPVWNNWLRNNMERETKQATTSAVKNHIDYNFYIAKLVSEEIKTKIRSKGVDISEVIQGKAVVNGVGYADFPVPPLGKDTITLFFWTDPAMQEAEKMKYMPNAEQGQRTLKGTR